jgi:hypothetical protein
LGGYYILRLPGRYSVHFTRTTLNHYQDVALDLPPEDIQRRYEDLAQQFGLILE